MNSPTVSPMTINALVAAAETWDAAFTEIPVNPQELEFKPDGVMCGGALFRTDQESRKRLFDKIGAPGQYLAKHSSGLQAAALAEHSARGDFGQKPRLVLRDGGLVTIVRGELSALSNAAVIKAVHEGVQIESRIESERLVVTRIAHDADRLDVELVCPSKDIAVRPGDIVQSGLHIVHERFGSQATLIEAFMYRLICTNGMTRRECVRDGLPRPRTRRLPADFRNSRELQMKQIRRLAFRNWYFLRSKLEALQATSERPADVEKLLTRYLQQARISINNMMPRLLAAWREEGAENTHYGAVNALTRVATHDNSLSERQRRTLASLAGLLAFAELHICELCFSVLSRSAVEISHAR